MFENYFVSILLVFAAPLIYCSDKKLKIANRGIWLIRYITFFFFFLYYFSDRVETDVGAVYHQLTDTYHSSPSEGDSDVADVNMPGPSGRKQFTDWKTACEGLLREMYDGPDSAPFREPVDLLEHPTYRQVRCILVLTSNKI